MSSTHTAADYRTPDAYPLQVGDRVYDIKQLCDESISQPEAAIVFDTGTENVFETTFSPRAGTDGTPRSLSIADYEPNERFADYDTSTRVVTIAWTSWLDANTPEWRRYRDSQTDLREYLRTQERSWDIPVEAHSYDYPESRLRLVDRTE